MTAIAAALPRRGLILGLTAALIAGGAAEAATRSITVYKTPYCGCCKGWITHMARAGFSPKVIEVEDLGPIRARHGVPFRLSSCHTGLIGGYVVEGHVPPQDVARPLPERPRALGTPAPGLPICPVARCR